MIRYLNLSGNSGVESYAEYDDALHVRFRDNPTVYVYSHRHPGKAHVDAMKRLAREGKGLSAYISQYVRDDHDTPG